MQPQVAAQLLDEECDLTGLDVANESLLEEAAAAPRMHVRARHLRQPVSSDAYFHLLAWAAPQARGAHPVVGRVHPQTLAAVRTRAEGLWVRILEADPAAVYCTGLGPGASPPCGVLLLLLLQCHDTDGAVSAHAAGALVVVAADLPACLPARCADAVAVGSVQQRFGAPSGCVGGPHAGLFAAKGAQKRRLSERGASEERGKPPSLLLRLSSPLLPTPLDPCLSPSHLLRLPAPLLSPPVIGVTLSVNAQGGRALLRMATQTRGQHIRRDKSESHICTTQVGVQAFAFLLPPPAHLFISPLPSLSSCVSPLHAVNLSPPNAKRSFPTWPPSPTG